MKHGKSGWRLLAGTASLALVPVPAYALVQPSEAPAAAADEQLAEIVVTATRRAERLQDVPVAVTAISGQELERQQIKSVEDLGALAPTLSIGQSTSDPTDITIGIRGLVVGQSQLVVDPAVGLYVDGIYYARTVGANVGLVDMERVEVLRGPQGTLFGRNTIGGALNITTNKPTDQLSGSVNLQYGNYDTLEATAIANLPFGDSGIAARLVYQHVEHDGYSRNAFLDEPLDSLNQDFVRASVRIAPDGPGELLLTGDYLKATGDSQIAKLFYFNPAGPFNATIPAASGSPGDLGSNYVGGDFHTGFMGMNPGVETKAYSFSATATLDLGDDATFKSISGYRNISSDRPNDLDGTPYIYLELLTRPFRDKPSIEQDQISQELQIFGDALNGRLSWIAGGYYFQESGYQGNNVRQLNQPTVNISEFTARNTSVGAFAQLGYELIDGLTLTGGLRYTKDTREAVYTTASQVIATGAETCTLNALLRDAPTLCRATPPDKSFSYWPWTASLDWKATPDILVYGKVTRGFRSGGFPQSPNPPTSTALFVSFAPEKATSYELGGKFEFLGRRVRINLAGFYTDYEGIQQFVNVTQDGLPVTLTLNGSGRIYGGEIEAVGRLGDLTVAGGLGLLDPKYDAGTLFAGQPFLNVAKTTLSLRADYPIELNGGSLRLSSDYVWRSTQFFANPLLTVPAAADAVKQEGYGLLNGRIAFEFDRLPLSLALFGRNLFNKDYKTRAFDQARSALGFVSGPVGDPRTYGVSLSYKFGS